MIILKSPAEIEKIRVSCKIVVEALGTLKSNICDGISTLELNRIAEEIIYKKGARPAFKNYRGYPCSLCTSINEEVVHGIPSAKRIIKNGDVVSLDLGVIHEGYFGDVAITVGVGNISKSAKRLIDITEKSLYVGIEQIKIGNYLSDISYAIQNFVEGNKYSVVKTYVGHGIGTSLHEEPEVPNFGEPKQGPKLRTGMVFTVEPMVNEGKSEVELKDDKWTTVTIDRKLSAHFEHAVAITENGVDILSK